MTAKHPAPARTLPRLPLAPQHARAGSAVCPGPLEVLRSTALKNHLSLAIVLATLACAPSHDDPSSPSRAIRTEHLLVGPGDPATVAAQLPGEIEVPPPPFTEGIFPCTDCHDPEIEVNRRRRTLATSHQEITLRHDEEHRWCLDCHSAENRDKLHLASGELVDFEQSYKLCGQCHGDKYRDWRAGVHGRRSGQWDGHKTYLLCVHCHDSHAPAFKPLKPLPPPPRPGTLGPSPVRFKETP